MKEYVLSNGESLIFSALSLIYPAIIVAFHFHFLLNLLSLSLSLSLSCTTEGKDWFLPMVFGQPLGHVAFF